MYITRNQVESRFVNELTNLSNKVLFLRGARQVGKTTFVNSTLKNFNDYKIIKCNFLYLTERKIENELYFGREVFDNDPTGEKFVLNIKAISNFENIKKKLIVFVDEADQFPICLESIQNLATYSKDIKFIFTGSNLENIISKNAATGRKHYFDLYPISFEEFLENSDKSLLDLINKQSIDRFLITEYFHNKLIDSVNNYIRIGGMPEIVSRFLDNDVKSIPLSINSLVQSIEDNIKSIINDSRVIYEYINILRKIAFFSMNTLKISKIQTNNASRKDALQILNKAIGARVVHKLSLIDSTSDLSKYIIFDSGVCNYLLNGSDLLNNNISENNLGLLMENFVASELISKLYSRNDLWYWKSGNKAELEFMLKYPLITGIDVKASFSKRINSLNSFALREDSANALVLISDCLPSFDIKYKAKLATSKSVKNIPLLKIPFYLSFKLLDYLNDIKLKI